MNKEKKLTKSLPEKCYISVLILNRHTFETHCKCHFSVIIILNNNGKIIIYINILISYSFLKYKNYIPWL